MSRTHEKLLRAWADSRVSGEFVVLEFVLRCAYEDARTTATKDDPKEWERGEHFACFTVLAWGLHQVQVHGLSLFDEELQRTDFSELALRHVRGDAGMVSDRWHLDATVPAGSVYLRPDVKVMVSVLYFALHYAQRLANVAGRSEWEDGALFGFAHVLEWGQMEAEVVESGEDRRILPDELRLDTYELRFRRR
jgi:hypothetical protein